MNTQTPETDQWETYCDECYYHMWRLRRKTERGWDDGYHIHTGEEAKGLCDLLNNLERELDELRRWTSVNGVIDLQRERDEAREQRDRLAATIERLKELPDTWRNECQGNWLRGGVVLQLADDFEAAVQAVQSLNQNEP